MRVQHHLGTLSWRAHWCHLANTSEPSMCGGNTAVCEITFTVCYYYATLQFYVCKCGLLWPMEKRGLFFSACCVSVCVCVLRTSITWLIITEGHGHWKLSAWYVVGATYTAVVVSRTLTCSSSDVSVSFIFAQLLVRGIHRCFPVCHVQRGSIRDVIGATIIIIRPHRSTTYVDAPCCYRLSSMVCWFVCLSVTLMSPVKTATPIEMQFYLWIRMNRARNVLD